MNGDRRGDDFTVGSTVTYTCNSGYQLKGAKSVFCQRNRQWSENQPTCERELPLFFFSFFVPKPTKFHEVHKVKNTDVFKLHGCLRCVSYLRSFEKPLPHPAFFFFCHIIFWCFLVGDTRYLQ